MFAHPVAVVGLLVTLTWADLSAQQSACSLLTPGDIETITGAKPGEPHKTAVVVPSGPAKGQTVNGCMWGVTDQGMVSLNTMAVLKGAAREASLAQMSQAFAMLKAQHWTEEKKEFPNGYCSIMTPPPSQKDVPISSGCFTEAKGLALGAGFMSPTQRLSIEKTKALLDKAVSRIP